MSLHGKFRYQVIEFGVHFHFLKYGENSDRIRSTNERSIGKCTRKRNMGGEEGTYNQGTTSKKKKKKDLLENVQGLREDGRRLPQ